MATRKPRKRAVPEGSAPEPVDDSLEALRDAAMGCKRCPLWKPATRTVFGEGPDDARVLVVGEQPGDAEDLSGHPFVGPAGKLFERRGKARLHKSPNPSEQRACRLWLEGEIDRIRPGIIVCLGAIAARSVLGNGFRLMRQRGAWQELPDGTRAFATMHPSAVLRQRDSAARANAYRDFVADLGLLSDA